MDGRIIEYDRCKTSHTLALEDGTYCYCTLKDELPLREYLAAAYQRACRVAAFCTGADRFEG